MVIGLLHGRVLSTYQVSEGMRDNRKLRTYVLRGEIDRKCPGFLLVKVGRLDRKVTGWEADCFGLCSRSKKFSSFFAALNRIKN
jgi:hypothetical protein